MRRHEGLPDVLRPAEVARVLRVHVGTLRRWDKEGRLCPFTRSVGGQRRYARADVLALLGEDGAGGEKTAAVYARVGTAKQAEAGNLERQRLRLLENAAVNGYRVVLQAGGGCGVGPERAAAGMAARGGGGTAACGALSPGGVSGSAGALGVAVLGDPARERPVARVRLSPASREGQI